MQSTGSGCARCASGTCGSGRASRRPPSATPGGSLSDADADRVGDGEGCGPAGCRSPTADVPAARFRSGAVDRGTLPLRLPAGSPGPCAPRLSSSIRFACSIRSTTPPKRSVASAIRSSAPSRLSGVTSTAMSRPNGIRLSSDAGAPAAAGTAVGRGDGATGTIVGVRARTKHRHRRARRGQVRGFGAEGPASFAVFRLSAPRRIPEARFRRRPPSPPSDGKWIPSRLRRRCRRRGWRGRVDGRRESLIPVDGGEQQDDRGRLRGDPSRGETAWPPTAPPGVGAGRAFRSSVSTTARTLRGVPGAPDRGEGPEEFPHREK